MMAAYAGVRSFIRKLVTFKVLVQPVRTLGQYWRELVELPLSVTPG